MRRLMIWALALGMVAAACSQTSPGADDALTARSETTVAAASEEGSDASAEPTAVDARAPDDAFGGAEAVLAFGVLPADARIIREAAMEIRVEQGTFEQRFAELRRIAADLGGYVSDATTGITSHDDEDHAFGTITLRIPTDRYDDAVDRLDGLGERLSLAMNTQDVSAEFVDLEARLRHWEASEEFYLLLLTEAETTADAISIKNQLDNVQLTIEQIEGRLRYLEDRTSLSSLTVTMTEAPDAVPVPVEEEEEPGIIEQALQEAGAVTLGIFSFLIVAGAAVIPLAMLALLVYGMWRLGRRFMSPRGETA